MEEVLEQEDYEVRIGSFNGPMDLLVYLVQKKEMSLDQIPIAEIADQFSAWVDAYSKSADVDLSKAGDFLSMAGRLMALKVQELLPAEERDPELEQEYNEDREALMKEMLEYQRFKQVAGGLQEMEGKNFGTFSRGRLEKSQNEEDTLADANIWQLFRAYQKSLKTKISETVHHIELDYVTIQDRQQAINNYLSVNGRALFEDLLDNDSHPIVAAVTFMALLEMIKTDELVFRQSELFGPIWIYRKKNNAEYADEMARETVFFSKDPDVKPGLVEEIRNQAIARSQAGSVGDIAAVMREAVLWTTRGRNVTEDDLQAMLEGREDLSEVQDNPYADLIQEQAKAAETEENSADAAPEIQASQQPTIESDIPSIIPDMDPSSENSLGDEPADEISNESSSTSSDGENYDAIANTVTTPAVSQVENLQEAENLPSISSNSEMSDEEFAEFMKKAQEYYSGNQDGSSDNPDEVTATESTNGSARVQLETESHEITTDHTAASKPQYTSTSFEEHASVGNEMTDAEYIAYLNSFAKKDSEDEDGAIEIHGAND